jgi:hypothetical protein
MMHFVIVYQMSTAAVELKSFKSSAKAHAYYSALEIKSLRDTDTEVVLIGASSESALRQTHPHYFSKSDSVVGSVRAMQSLRSVGRLVPA